MRELSIAQSVAEAVVERTVVLEQRAPARDDDLPAADRAALRGGGPRTPQRRRVGRRPRRWTAAPPVWSAGEVDGVGRQDRESGRRTCRRGEGEDRG